jgi:hypothetical protein
MPMPQEEVTQAGLATHVMTVCATEASAQEVTAVWQSTVALVKDAEDQAALAESTTALASACGKVEGFARRIALLEVELTEAHQAQETVEENS